MFHNHGHIGGFNNDHNSYPKMSVKRPFCLQLKIPFTIVDNCYIWISKNSEILRGKNLPSPLTL